MMVMFISVALTSYSRLRKAQEENLRTELAYLRAQINPHFLFNTLNSIYALTVKKSDAAPESVTRLSSIMRYVISNAAADTVELEKEIDYLRSYIELEQLRLTPKTTLHYSFPTQTAGRMVAPLVFLPLIENVFKYGVSTTETSFIEINMSLNGNDLLLSTRNSRPAKEAVQSSGLGVANVKKRLALLYPARHSIAIEETEKEFSVTLSLSLK
jgi:LytS/YehU family sensor histidine kinase